jgi:hypothetical protein
LYNLKRFCVVATAIAAVLVGSGGMATASNSSVENVTSCPSEDAGGDHCTWALAAVNMRTQPTSQSQYIATIPKDGWFGLYCWTTGEPIHGDNVWYYGVHTEHPNGVPVFIYGWVTGYYLATGHDPAPQIGHC